MNFEFREDDMVVAYIMSQKATVLKLYRSLLKEASYLPHDYLKTFWTIRIRNSFRRNAVLSTPGLKETKLKTARKELRQLQAANRGEIVAVKRVLDFAYGRRGKLRRELLAEIQADPTAPTREPIIPANPSRSRPPPLPASLVSLFTFHGARSTGKTYTSSELHSPPTFPPQADPNTEDARLLGPLSLRRKVNLHWKFYSQEITRTLPPLQIRLREVTQDHTGVVKDTDSRIELGAAGIRPIGVKEAPVFDTLEALATPQDMGPIRKRRLRYGVVDASSTSPSPSSSSSSISIEKRASAKEDVSTLNNPGAQLGLLGSRGRRFMRRRYHEVLARTPILHYVYKTPTEGGDISSGKYAASLSPIASRGPSQLGRPFSPRMRHDDRNWIERSEERDAMEAALQKANRRKKG